MLVLVEALVVCLDFFLCVVGVVLGVGTAFGVALNGAAGSAGASGEAAFAFAASRATAGRARPMDARRCLREKVTAGSRESRGLRVQASNTW